MSSPINNTEKVNHIENQGDAVSSDVPSVGCNQQLEEKESNPSNSEKHDELVPQTSKDNGVRASEISSAAIDSHTDALKANSDHVSGEENEFEGFEGCDFSWEGFEVVDEFDEKDSSPASDRSGRKPVGRHDKERHRSRSRCRSSHQSGDRRSHRYKDRSRHRDRHRYSDKKSKYSRLEDKRKSSRQSKEDSSKEKHKGKMPSDTRCQLQQEDIEQEKEEISHKSEREWKEERNVRKLESQISGDDHTQSEKVKNARYPKHKYDEDCSSSTKEKNRTRKNTGFKKVRCRSSWKNFKRVLVVCDSRVKLDESSLKECCSISVQVLVKPYVTLDDIPALLSEHIGSCSPVATLLICSVGTYDLIQLQDSKSCKELMHEPSKCICLKSKESKDPEVDILSKSKDLKKTLQQLLGMESEIYFTSILPFSLKLYQETQATWHKNTTGHETLCEVSASDLKEWELKIYEEIRLFNEYHAKKYPLHLSLQLANFTQCLVKELENFFKTSTGDGLNLEEEFCHEITSNLGKTINRYCTARGKYERVILVGDSRLDHVRKAWPVDIRYNCKFLTHPELRLRHLCNPNNEVVKELSYARNSLIVISVGIYDLCNLVPHNECSSHPLDKLEILVPANYNYHVTFDYVTDGMCRLIMDVADNLKRITEDCDIIFSTIYEFDLLAHQAYLMLKHEKEVHHIVRKPTLRLSSKFRFKVRSIVSAIAMFNKISVAYSQKNSFPVWDVLSVISDRLLIDGQYHSISPEVLYDGIHPSPSVAAKLAEKHRLLADDALKIESSSRIGRTARLDVIANTYKKKKDSQLFTSYHEKESSEGQDKDGNTASRNEQPSFSLKVQNRRSSQASVSSIAGGDGSCMSPTSLLSEISDSGSSGPLDETPSVPSFTAERHPRSKSPAFSELRESRHAPVRRSDFSLKYGEQVFHHHRKYSAVVSRYPRSPSPVHWNRYRRSLCSFKRSRSRSLSPSQQCTKYIRSVSYTTQRGYSRSPSPYGRERRQTPPYFMKRKSYSRSPSGSGRSSSSVSPLHRSHSPDIGRRRSSLENSRESKALDALWEVHNRECAVYRKHPIAHPDYEKEYRLFKSKKEQCIFNLGGDLNSYDITNDWQTFWTTRLEQLLGKSWITKKEKCLALLRSEPTKSKRKNRSRRRSSSEDSTSIVKSRVKKSKLLRKTKNYNRSMESPERKRRYSDEDIDKKSSDDEQISLRHENDSESEGVTSEHSVSEEDVSKHGEENEHGKVKSQVDSGNYNDEQDVVGLINSGSHRVNDISLVDGKSESVPSCDKNELESIIRVSEDLESHDKVDPQQQQLLKNPGSSLKSAKIILNEMQRDRYPVENIKNNVEEWRNPDSEHTKLESKEEPADEVSSTTPSFEDGKQEDFIGVLDILNRMGEKLGILKLPLKVVLDKALQYKSMGLDPFELLKEKDTKTLFVMISEKLGEMSNEDTLNIITKVVLQEANERLRRILKASGPDLDMSQIAQKCLGKNESDTVAYIQSQFLEQGISEPTNDQLKEVYEAVRLERSRLLTQILKQTSIESSSLHITSSNSAHAALSTSENVLYSPTQAGWSSEDSQDANLSQSRSRLVTLKDEYGSAETQNICLSLPHLPESRIGLHSAPQFSAEKTKQSGISLSNSSSSKQEPVANTQLSTAVSKLADNIYDSVSEDYVRDKTIKTKTVLSSTLDYGLASPSTSKDNFSESFECYSVPEEKNLPPRPLLTNSQVKTTGNSSFSRKDPIRLVIPKGKSQGQNLLLPSPVMDDSGWQ